MSYKVRTYIKNDDKTCKTCTKYLNDGIIANIKRVIKDRGVEKIFCCRLVWGRRDPCVFENKRE